MIYDGWNLFVQSPEGCLLVWENWSQKVFKKSVRRVYNDTEGVG